MKNRVRFLASLGMAAALLIPGTALAKDPVVNSAMAGNDPATGKPLAILMGNSLTKFKVFDLRSEDGSVSFGAPNVVLKTKNVLLLDLLGGLAAGDYLLRLDSGKGFILDVPFRWDAGGATFTGPLVGTSATDGGIGVTGNSTGLNGTGVLGSAEGTGPAAYGVWGLSPGTGVLGSSNGTDQFAHGVRGYVTSEEGVGVVGANTETSGRARGVLGETGSDAGIAVMGEAYSATGATVGVKGLASSDGGTGVLGICDSLTGTIDGVRGVVESRDGAGVHGINDAALDLQSTGATAGVHGEAITGIGVFGEGLIGVATSGVLYGAKVHSSGGTTLSVEKDATSGTIAVFKSDGTSVARIDANGDVVINGTLTQNGSADFAERVAVDRAASEFAPGDVVVIDTTAERRFTLSSAPASTLVAGVVSSKPAILAGLSDASGDGWRKTEIPMAMTGIVPCKVCDEGGSIRPGDLLVTSSTSGRAMRAGPNPAPGTVLGKALGFHVKGAGTVEVFLMAR